MSEVKRIKRASEGRNIKKSEGQKKKIRKRAAKKRIVKQYGLNKATTANISGVASKTSKFKSYIRAAKKFTGKLATGADIVWDKASKYVDDKKAAEERKKRVLKKMKEI